MREIGKTSRVLSVYHLFRNCREVSFEELRQQLGVSEKTSVRDIRLLERAGVLKVRYERKYRAFYPVSLELCPVAEEENQTRRRYLEKLRRLCLLMARMEAEAEWSDTGKVELYRVLFPEQSDRTRQRDYRELEVLGYRAQYYREFDDEPGRWWYDIPGAYELATFL